MKFLENRLEEFKIRSLVLYLFLLKLGINFNSTLSCAEKSSRITKILFEKKT